MWCALALVLMLDASGSVPPAAWQGLVDAHADALADDRIAATMSAGGLTAITVIGYSDAPHVLVPWRVVDVPEDAARLAREVAAVQRPGNSSTQTGRALRFAGRHLQSAPCTAERQVVDLVTDGPGDDAQRTAEAREELIAGDVRVNVLAVNTYGADAAGWAREHVATPGGFVAEAAGWPDVARALRRKIVREIVSR